MDEEDQGGVEEAEWYCRRGGCPRGPYRNNQAVRRSKRRPGPFCDSATRFRAGLRTLAATAAGAGRTCENSDYREDQCGRAAVRRVSTCPRRWRAYKMHGMHRRDRSGGQVVILLSSSPRTHATCSCICS
ncbi:hypothetical protein PVAP13_4NG244011 [Panicum virgatum]|uniref:Uncharacterized protein n=1 Tax=Panicum virgatum TaxID=38727 RepID=A0A8T0TEB5_PANVG|nr:hypothetical protein PVAP13_4NG244011 [Panicum virgatum]